VLKVPRIRHVNVGMVVDGICIHCACFCDTPLACCMYYINFACFLHDESLPFACRVWCCMVMLAIFAWFECVYIMFGQNAHKKGHLGGGAELLFRKRIFRTKTKKLYERRICHNQKRNNHE